MEVVVYFHVNKRYPAFVASDKIDSKLRWTKRFSLTLAMITSNKTSQKKKRQLTLQRWPNYEWRKISQQVLMKISTV